MISLTWNSGGSCLRYFFGGGEFLFACFTVLGSGKPTGNLQHTVQYVFLGTQMVHLFHVNAGHILENTYGHGRKK